MSSTDRIPLALQLLRAYCHYFPLMKGKWRLTTRIYHSLDIPPMMVESMLDKTLKVSLRLDIWVDFNIYCFGLYEYYLAQFFMRQLKPDTSFIDVGAYLGQYSLLAARDAPDGQAYAFEPNRASAERLTANVRKNGFSNIHVIENAVGDRSGLANFYIATQPFQSSVVSSHADHEQVARVPLCTLDEFYEERALSRVDIIKIDVEEAEDDVIAGAGALLKSFRPLVLVEIGRASATRGHSKALELLEGLGYRFFVLDRKRLVPFPGHFRPGIVVIGRSA